MYRSAAIALFLLTLGPATTRGADPRLKDAMHRGMRYLVEHQNPDGGYGPFEGPLVRIPKTSDVGITGLALTAIARHPRGYRAVDGPFVSKAVDYLLSRQQEDGGFYDPRDPSLKNYRTSVAIMALSALDRTLYARPIERATRYIQGLQLAESRGYRPEKHLSYGAIGYGGSSFRGDLSNTGTAASALRDAGVSAGDPLWRRLESFVSRCQNFSEVDPLLARSGIGTSGDGGFRYAPNDTRGPVESVDGGTVFSSYGSMSYQGLKSLLYAGVSREDPRVIQAFRWIAANFTVDENPGMASPLHPEAGKQGLFYYYHTMAKALEAYGEPILIDRKGQRHDWAHELSAKLIELQHPEGHWVNASDRWWENIPELDTAFALIALSICEEELGRREAEAVEGGDQDAKAPAADKKPAAEQSRRTDK